MHLDLRHTHNQVSTDSNSEGDFEYIVFSMYNNEHYISVMYK